MPRSRSRTAAAAATAALLALPLAVTLGTAPASAAPRADRPGKGEVVTGSWIVVFEPGTRGARGLARQMAEEDGAELVHVYEHALQGYAARMSEAQADRARRHPKVASVEPDRVATLTDTQANPVYGLDRIDQRALPLDKSYTDGDGGAGVHAYVVDTGINTAHVEFTGRTGAGYDAITSGGSGSDCHGHGTHVAGTLAGTQYGVADQVVVHPVRVLGCNGSGTNSGVIAGLDWVRANAVKPAVANMSLGGGASTAVDSAVRNLVASGVSVVVAAGNDNRDACTSSPARVAEALTVGATTSTDARASYSNTGSCLDLFAPGSGITSAWYTSSTATSTLNGTSMAAPHVAGAVALLQSATPAATPVALHDTIVSTATTGVITGAGSGSPNRLLFTSPSGATPPPPAPAPAPGPLLNGGFEEGQTGWTTSDGAIIGTGSGYTARTGAWSAWLGGYDRAADSASQVVTVPAGASLSYAWRLTTSESTLFAYDTMRVRVYDATSGALLSTLRTRSNTAARNAWYTDALSLSSFAGQSVRLAFEVTTDSSVPSSFHVDDVSVG